MTPEEKRKLADWIRKLVKDEVDKAMSKPKRQKKDYPTNFDSVWKIHPKGGKDAAFNAYKKIDHEKWPDLYLIGSISDHKKTEWKDRPADKLPHLSTFLNGGYYKTEIKTVRKQDSRRRCGCGAYALDGQDKCAKCQCERTE